MVSLLLLFAYIFLTQWVSKKQISTVVLESYSYAETSLNVLCGFNIFLTWGLFLVWIFAVSFLSMCWPLIGVMQVHGLLPHSQQGKGSGWLPVWVPQHRQLVAHTLGRKGQWLVLCCGTFSSSDGSLRAHPWEGGGRDPHLFTGCLVVAVVCSCLWSLRWQQWLASAPVGSRWYPAA